MYLRRVLAPLIVAITAAAGCSGEKLSSYEQIVNAEFGDPHFIPNGPFTLDRPCPDDGARLPNSTEVRMGRFIVQDGVALQQPDTKMWQAFIYYGYDGIEGFCGVSSDGEVTVMPAHNSCSGILSLAAIEQQLPNGCFFDPVVEDESGPQQFPALPKDD